jgi:hypothetical protein
VAVERPLAQPGVGADIIDGQIAVSLPRDAAPGSVEKLPAALLARAFKQLWHPVRLPRIRLIGLHRSIPVNGYPPPSEGAVEIAFAGPKE